MSEDIYPLVVSEQNSRWLMRVPKDFLRRNMESLSRPTLRYEIWKKSINLLIPGLAWLLTLTLFSHGICDKKNWSPRIALLPQLEMWNLQISSWKQLCVIQCWGIDNWVVTTYHTAPPAETKYSPRSNSCPPVTSLATWRLVIQTNAVFEPIICAFIASAVPGNTLQILHFAGTRLLVPDSVD